MPGDALASGKGRRPRVLFLCRFIPDPDGNGLEKRLFSFLLAYSTFADVELFHEEIPARGAPGVPAATAEICAATTSCTLHKLLDPADPHFATFQASLAVADVVHTKLPWLIKRIDHPNIVWDIDEVPHHFRVRSGLLAPFYRRTRKFRNYRAISDQVTATIACSNVECRIMGGDCTVIPNVVPDPGLIQTRETEAEGPVFLFVGAMGHYPNYHGIHRFVGSIWPHLRASHPTARLQVVGRLPPHPVQRAGIEALSRVSGLDYAPNVPTVTPYYQADTVVIAPIWKGAGTRVKIIEAFAHGAPVVSTVKGAEGLEVTDKKELIIAKSSRGLLAACRDLADDPAARQRLGAAGRRFFEQNHMQATVTENLKALVQVR